MGFLLTYGAIGVIFAFPFVFRGVNRIDPVARESSWGFRVAILAGSAALWPLVLRRWLSGQTAPGEHNPHRDAAAKSS